MIRILIATALAVVAIGITAFSSCSTKPKSGTSSEDDETASGTETGQTTSAEDSSQEGGDTAGGSPEGGGLEGGGLEGGGGSGSTNILKKKLSLSTYRFMGVATEKSTSLGLVSGSEEDVLVGITSTGTIDKLSITEEQDTPENDPSPSEVGDVSDDSISEIPADPDPVHQEVVYDTGKLIFFLSFKFQPPQTTLEDGTLAKCYFNVFDKSDESLTCWPWLMATRPPFMKSASGNFVAISSLKELPPENSFDGIPKRKFGIYMIEAQPALKLHTVLEGDEYVADMFALNDRGDVAYVSATERHLKVRKTDGTTIDLGDASQISCMVPGRLFPNDIWFIENGGGSSSRLGRITAIDGVFNAARTFLVDNDTQQESSISDFHCRTILNDWDGEMYAIGIRGRTAENPKGNLVAVLWREHAPLQPIELPINGIEAFSKEHNQRGMFAAGKGGLFVSGIDSKGKRVIKSARLNKTTNPPSMTLTDLGDVSDVIIHSMASTGGKLQVQGRRISDNKLVSFEYDADLTKTDFVLANPNIKSLFPIEPYIGGN